MLRHVNEQVQAMVEQQALMLVLLRLQTLTPRLRRWCRVGD